MKNIFKFSKIARNYSTKQIYDLVVIGGGPGGYVAAIKGAQLGLNVCCVEKRGSLGGTCLNVGCIPSKALLHASELYEELNHVKDWGISLNGEQSVDVTKLQRSKSSVVRGLTKGVEHLFKKNGVTYLQGSATIENSSGDVKVEMLEDSSIEEITGTNIIIATGSDVQTLPFLPIDEKVILSSTGALDLPEVPKNLAVIGTGAIALELGSVWSRLGADVSVFYYREEVARYLDDELRPLFRKALEKGGLKFHLDTDVFDCEIKSNSAILSYKGINSDEEFTEEFETVLVGVGRVPYFGNVGVESLGIELTDAGQIKVNECFETSISNIFAIGDCIPGPMLAHKAEEDGIMCVEYIHSGKVPHVDYNLIPAVVYTKPEVAQVGLREQDLEEGSFITGKFVFAANGRARAMLQGDGMVKVIADKETEKLLGMHMIGPHVSEMIMEGALTMHSGLSVRDIAEACHPHPTLSEAIKEAAMDCIDKPIHS